MDEIWKAIDKYERYMVSNLGRFKNVNSSDILNPRIKGSGYATVSVYNYSGKRTYKLHRLVAIYFIGPAPDARAIVHHKDGDKQNNNVDNLEWTSPKKHVQHHIEVNPKQLAGMIFHNRYFKGKAIIQLSKDGGIAAKYINAADAAKAVGTYETNILEVANQAARGKNITRRTAGGYRWRFAQ